MEHSTNKSSSFSIVMMGASGAVGGEALKKLLNISQVKQLTLLGRREISELDKGLVKQHQINIFEPDSYANLLGNHDTAICTLGVGQPSKISKEKFLSIDKTAVLDFAKACKKVGVSHFELLSSVGINSKSRSFFLRSKGELVDELIALNFDRLSIFQPSMILTPTNRYGFSQAMTLAIWPYIKPLLLGSWRQYRGVKVATLGQSMALNILAKKKGIEYLKWDDFEKLVKNKS